MEVGWLNLLSQAQNAHLHEVQPPEHIPSLPSSQCSSRTAHSPTLRPILSLPRTQTPKCTLAAPAETCPSCPLSALVPPRLSYHCHRTGGARGAGGLFWGPGRWWPGQNALSFLEPGWG